MRIKVLSGGRKSIELPLSDAELNFQMKRIGIEEIVPVCRLVEASEKDNPLCKFEGQTDAGFDQSDLQHEGTFADYRFF